MTRHEIDWDTLPSAADLFGEIHLSEQAPAPATPAESVLPGLSICAVAAASIVGEAMVAITLCDAVLEKFGADSLRELKRNVEGYRLQTTEF